MGGKAAPGQLLRPKLGLRPWFAFLRRAMYRPRLRRALAFWRLVRFDMAGRLTATSSISALARVWQMPQGAEGLAT